MAKSGQEVVFEGWLTKSPPPKLIWKGRWRRRWFSLRHSGEIPNQFILMYYADRNCRELKGLINLDDCEQVDLGLKLDVKKLKFDHVFDIKTPTRTYYLAAETENEMKSWVNCICKVCGLKSTSDEEDLHNISDHVTIDSDVAFSEEEEKDDKHLMQNTYTEAPPVPVTTPYISLADCWTLSTPVLHSQNVKEILAQNSQRLSGQNHANQTYGVSQRNYMNYVNDIQDPRFYDSPRVLTLNRCKGGNLERCGDSSGRKDGSHSPLHHSPTDSESVFTDDDNNADVCIVGTQRLTKASANGGSKTAGAAAAPPRPPKPLQVGSATSYINLNMHSSSPSYKHETDKDGSNEKIESKSESEGSQIPITDDMYDFPRSHQVDASDAVRTMLSKRHCYNNAAPGSIEGQIFRYDISPKPSTSSSQVFRYDAEDLQDEPASPLSQGSSTTGYSNLPSPVLNDTTLMPPPIVNRELKPRRKLSDSLSLCSNPEPSSPRGGGPSVDRKLKPPTPLQEEHMRKAFNDDTRTMKPGASPTLKAGPCIYENSRKARTGHSISSHPDDELSSTHLHHHQQRRIRAAPSPTPPGLTRSLEALPSNDHEQIYYHEPEVLKLRYVHLEHLDCSPSSLSGNLTNTMPSKSSGANSSSSSNSCTVYKKVDFDKTAAFNRTREELEKERQVPMSFVKK